YSTTWVITVEQVNQREGMLRMGLLWTLIIGGVIGWLGGLIIGRNVPGGIIGNIVAGLVGAWLGSLILGDFGPSMGGFYLIPAILGAIVIVLIISALMRGTRRA
ncbi:MAG: GlsB/YeaQ/YmgE family stress response rane protein, partial [Paenibacillus sp.]|nr:GlsB/YeaQ/YmgE family stress response rane protein [Paenibacillus sp.]